MNNKEEIAKKVSKTLQELSDSVAFENIIKDNKIEFVIKDVQYRVRKPNLCEQEIADKEKNRKYVELINDDNCLFREQWIEKYKSKGIDIEKMESKIRQLETEIEKILLKLATVSNEADVDLLKSEIEILRNEQIDLTIKKTDLLSYSIEDKLLYHVNTYVTYLVLEKKENDKYTKVFDSFEEFSSSKNSALINKSFYCINLIVYNQNEL